MNGRGSLYSASQKLAYQGEWKNDQFHGLGTLYNQIYADNYQSLDYYDFNKLTTHWSKYEGDFINDQKSGIGILYFNNNQKFTGKFEFNQLNGKGTFYKSHDNIIHATWKNNILLS